MKDSDFRVLETQLKENSKSLNPKDLEKFLCSIDTSTLTDEQCDRFVQAMDRDPKGLPPF